MIREEIKAKSLAALKARDRETRELLSGVLGLFIEKEKTADFAGWTEASERGLVAKYVKSLKGSIEAMAGTELAAKYQSEVDLLEPYLPQVMDEAATRALVEGLVPECQGLGQLMGRVMKDHKGSVDGGLVRRIATELGLK
ncbi:MAG: GatB/YqeY domain-containing protein [Myxococcota bacterium]|nr:GatB/YqeY domain-containing protein [Myxococcota bacterium]